MFKGIIPPVPTPFKPNGDLDTDSLQKLIVQLEPHVDGFLILGSNGEVPYLEESERLRVLEAAREAIPSNKPMIVGVGAESTRATIERARVAATVGGHAALRGVVARSTDARSTAENDRLRPDGIARFHLGRAIPPTRRCIRDYRDRKATRQASPVRRRGQTVSQLIASCS